MFTHFFIDQPVLSSVISILIFLGGAVAMFVSPISQYPELAPPQVTVEARYPGATAEVIAKVPFAPAEFSWINAARVPVIMDTGKAREKLGWDPAYDTRQTLLETVEGAREEGLV